MMRLVLHAGDDALRRRAAFLAFTSVGPTTNSPGPRTVYSVPVDAYVMATVRPCRA
jgi:hypothetical protein